MPKGRYATLTSWSFSVYTQYVKCPFSVCLDKIMRIRIQETDNPHLIHGNKVHDAAEVFIRGKAKKPPVITTPSEPGKQPLKADMNSIAEQLMFARNSKALTEQLWAFDKKWNPVDWKDWNNAWLRIKTDVCASTVDPPTVTVLDWKTGRVHPEHKQQRSLYALGGLRLVQLGQLAGGSPKVKLTAQHVYLDTGQSATEKFTMGQLKSLQTEWLARTRQMMTDTTFRTHTGSHCRFCKYRKSAGGPCPENM